MTSPSPYWYASRGLGIAMLLVLSAVVVLGIAGVQRWKAEGWPGFLTAGLHRNLSLLAVALLPLHGGTVLLDTFAALGWKDILLPFASNYRPLWLGLGVLSGELLIALVATSLVRLWLSPRLWRATHWAAYAAWPPAMLHGLGTGSDTRAGWAVFVYAACGAAVLLALLARLVTGRPQTRSRRIATALAVVAAAGIAAGWALNGPLRTGWAAAAGTPSRLLASTSGRPEPGAAAASPAPGRSVPAGLDDRIRGTISQQGSAAVVDLTDRGSGLEVVIQVPSPSATSGTLQVVQAGKTICSTQAAFDQDVTATCGGTAIQIVLEGGDDDRVVGTLVTQAAT
jgi:methionine sulfoxide reductase heme-binding subunit